MDNFLLRQQLQKLIEIIRLSELNLELLDTLEATVFWLYKYTEEHNIPLENRDSLNLLLKRARNLIEEITSPNIPKLLKKSRPEDYTEPPCACECVKPL